MTTVRASAKTFGIGNCSNTLNISSSPLPDGRGSCANEECSCACLRNRSNVSPTVGRFSISGSVFLTRLRLDIFGVADLLGDFGVFYDP